MKLKQGTGELIESSEGNSQLMHTSNLSSSVMVLKFFSLRKSHSLTTESSADVAK